MNKDKKLIIIVSSLIGGFILVAVLFNIFSPRQRNLKKIVSALDIENPTTRKFSLELAAKYPGEYNIDQVCKIYDHVYKNWKYVSDPRGLDYFSNASLTIDNNLTGDCDDFAILIAAAIESVGGKARINIAFNEKTGNAHAFTEVYFKGDPEIIRERIDYHFQNIFQLLFGISRVKEINYISDNGKGIWLNLDWNSKYPGGEYFDYTGKTIYYPRQNYYTTEKKE